MSSNERSHVSSNNGSLNGKVSRIASRDSSKKSKEDEELDRVLALSLDEDSNHSIRRNLQYLSLDRSNSGSDSNHAGMSPIGIAAEQFATPIKDQKYAAFPTQNASEDGKGRGNVSFDDYELAMQRSMEEDRFDRAGLLSRQQQTSGTTLNCCFVQFYSVLPT